MKKYIINDCQVLLPAGELLRHLRIPDDTGNENYLCVTEMLREALLYARPKYLFCDVALHKDENGAVIAEGIRLNSETVCENLKSTDRIVPCIATCGREVDDWSARFTSMLDHFWAETIKELLLYKTVEKMEEEIKNRFFPVGDMSHMNPGSLPSWPLSAQKELFGLIGDTARDIGVTLTENCLMIPAKSVSGFYFQHESHFENCSLCERPDCPKRVR